MEDVTGAYWQDVPKGQERLLVEKVFAHIDEEIKNCTNAKYRKALQEHKKKLGSKGQIDAMIELFKGLVSVRSDVFDRNPWLLNVKNGTLDLKTGLLRPAEFSDFISKQSPVVFNPDARAPRWEQFLQEVFEGKQDVIDYVQKAAGYSLTGINSEHVLFIMWGDGENGKSTFLESLRHVLQEYSASVASKTLMESRNQGGGNASGDVARLKGIRFANTTEAGEGNKFDEEKIKLLTSSDTITARFLYQDEFEFKPEFKLWIACNHRPAIRGTDRGIWRRIRLIPFTAFFPPEKREAGLEDRLKGEAEGILTWLVRGCARWQAEGLTPPAEVVEATAEYKADMDTLGGFLQSKCLLGPKYKANPSQLYAEFKAWAAENGEFILSQNRLILKLAPRGIHQIKTSRGAQLSGVGLRTHKHKGEEI